MPALQPIADVPGHADPAWAVAFNPARSLLASCSTDRAVRLYTYTLPPSSSDDFPSPSSPKPVFSLVTSIPTGHKRTVRSIAWAPGGRTLATASFDSTVGVWEEEEEGEWECVTTLEGHENECKSVAFSADGGLLASCSRDRSVWVWEVQPDADFECIAVMMDHGADVKAVAWHPHDELLASASYDSNIHLMFDDPDSDWTLVQRLKPALEATPLEIPATASPSLREALSPTPPEKEALALDIPPLVEDETVWSIAWSPNGRFLASGGDCGGVRLWERVPRAQAEAEEIGEMEVATGMEMREVSHTAAHAGAVFALAWGPGPGAGLLASASADGRIIVWEVEDGKLVPIAGVREAHGVADVNGLGWNVREDGKGAGLLASAADDGSVKVWRIVADE
ncbi:uncharacterized protein CcaverHIS019_0304190 [Cutaneotrichosporon cavernicola]|uniref:Probable cytosolic iron-sulfur protein assembly protein 1 n=1 Tax=Cutaneotrichosporon cavernicola TaxID=279322 RepID=A0AA48KZC6_9TREE|nr:uncharacterized protein CcaverHIS019_0304190 [Cutaneotrichosporon cavernicola]BEI90349.1 hypothetical protein CcaverHIS019_0304190 [Cutaneotrichosporon cavernicola]BEI98125.1 hypothetical protein CcaverHIS631_0304240 [Cutaneotrichosporon cavernicola]BEJ05902.1 hypothetical protein CcaverHIS641_0304240 [Cutaneotrichosporon cavernicola]